MSSTITLLQTAELPDWTRKRLDERFEVIDLPGDGTERERVLERHGARVRGIAGSGAGRIDVPLLERLPRLEIVSSYSAGLDAIDTDALAERNVKVFNTSAALAEEVADLAHWLVLSVSRQLVAAERYVREGKWPNGAYPLTRSLAGLKVGILGLGHIGKSLARRVEIAGSEIAYHGRREQPGVEYRYFATLHELAEWADALVVCCPATPETIRMVDASVLDRVGPEGFIVNIARGSIVDEAALIAALAENRLGGAGLDVFENEPHVPDELIADPRVVLLPHVGSATEQTRQRMGEMMIDALTRHFGL